MDINNKLFVGMDLHKNTSTFCVKDRDENIFKEAKVMTDQSQIKNFVKEFKDQLLSVTLEPVLQWHVYADLLQSLGCDVHLAHPMKVKAIASAPIKTDKIEQLFCLIYLGLICYLRLTSHLYQLESRKR